MYDALVFLRRVSHAVASVSQSPCPSVPSSHSYVEYVPRNRLVSSYCQFTAARRTHRMDGLVYAPVIYSRCTTAVACSISGWGCPIIFVKFKTMLADIWIRYGGTRWCSPAGRQLEERIWPPSQDTDVRWCRHGTVRAVDFWSRQGSWSGTTVGCDYADLMMMMIWRVRCGHCG